MEFQFSISDVRSFQLLKAIQSKVIQRSKNFQPLSSAINSIESDFDTSPAAVEDEFDVESLRLDSDETAEVEFEAPRTRKRSKKRKIYCFNCNRQEFHIMAYKGTWVHSFLVGMTFGTARIFGPYRCTCCGKKRAMFADFCSLSYHWRMASERRLSKSGRRRSRSSRRR